MKVSELIEKLSQLDPDARVAIYEGQYCEDREMTEVDDIEKTTMEIYKGEIDPKTFRMSGHYEKVKAVQLKV